MNSINKNPWMIFIGSKCIKIFPDYEQAFIWCVKKKLVFENDKKKHLNKNVKILQDY